MIYLQVDTGTREIKAHGSLMIAAWPGCDLVQVDDSLRSQLEQIGSKVLNVNGTITVTPYPPEVRYSGALTIDVRLRTTTATVTEIYRATLAQLTLYRARLELLGVDAGNGNARYIEARIVAKRLANGALMVGTPAILANVQDVGAATWAITANVSGNDFVITVAGQAGRNIDWHLYGDVSSFTPGGA